MGGDKIWPHDAITVQKNTIVAAGGQNRTVSDFCRPETAVSVPDVIETATEFSFPGVDQLCRGLTRAIVGNNDFETAIILSSERSQDRVERIFAVIGRNDDGNQFGHISTFQRPA